MKPTALLLSCDKNSEFIKAFLDYSSDVINVTDDQSSISNVDYVYIFADSDKNFIKQISSINTTKKVVIAAHQSVKQFLESSINLPNVKIVYYANILDVNHSSGFINNIFNSLSKGKVDVPSYDIDLHSISPADLASVMHECSFTFYSPGVHRFYIENGISLYSLIAIIQKAKPEVQFYTSSKSANAEDLLESSVKINPNIDYLNSYFLNLDLSKINSRKKLPKFTFSKLPLRKIAIRGGVLAATLPLLVFAISATSLYAGYWGINNNREVSEFAFKLSRLTAFHEPIKESAKVGERVLAVSDSTDFNFDTATPDELRDYFANVEVSLNSLFKSLSFSDSLVSADTTIENRELVLSVHELISLASILLGLERQTSYLIVFEDDNVIDSFIYTEVEDARVNYVQEFSVDQIDSNIEGSVQAPFNDQEQWSVADANWEKDFSEVSKRINWFFDKSQNLEADTVIKLDISQKDLISEYLVKNSQLVQIDKLTKLLALFKGNEINAYSKNLKLQSYAESENIASLASKSNSLSIYLNEFGFNPNQVKREVNAELSLIENRYSLNIDIEYTNVSNEIVSFYPRSYINSEGEDNEIVDIFPGETYEVTKTHEGSVVNNELSLYLNSLYLDETTSVKLKVYNQTPGFVGTVPHLNLTSDGALGYTTSLEQPITLEINLSK